ncbi:hypothetical protein GIB67_038281 [Kingdonia uniflora]|uniref:Replication factor A C-terminal domain-containing protein n=1 Tax=Kingdonia uniflora TaxID=39325 RepID=A0A7J7MSG7_9MAGN|nr:hypothetical protein GIB67_038281 [Kingdonia uniflora]
MAPKTYNLIENINHTIERWRLKVRVSRLWNMLDFGNKKNTNRIEMLLIDEKLHISGIYHLSSTMSVKLYINLGIPEVASFTQKCSLMDGHLTSITNAITNNPSTDESMFKNRKTILEIKDTVSEPESKGKFFCCKATIENVLNDTTWYYMSCEQCKKKDVNDRTTYWCKTCNMPIPTPTPRYCLRLKIEDTTGFLNIIAFENEEEILTQTPANSLFDLYNQEEEHESAFTILDKMIGTNLIFQVAVKPSIIKDAYSSLTIDIIFQINKHLEENYIQPPINEENDYSRSRLIEEINEQNHELAYVEGPRNQPKKQKLQKMIYSEDEEEIRINCMSDEPSIISDEYVFQQIQKEMNNQGENIENLECFNRTVNRIDKTLTGVIISMEEVKISIEDLQKIVAELKMPFPTSTTKMMSATNNMSSSSHNIHPVHRPKQAARISTGGKALKLIFASRSISSSKSGEKSSIT